MGGPAARWERDGGARGRIARVAGDRAGVAAQAPRRCAACSNRTSRGDRMNVVELMLTARAVPWPGGPWIRRLNRPTSQEPMAPKKSTRRAVSSTGADTERVRARFERLLMALVAVFSEHSLERVLQQLVDSARDVVGAKYAALGVLGPDGTSLAQFVTSGLSPEARREIGELPSGRGLLGLVIREPRPIRTADINTHPAKYGFPAHHPPMQSFLGVPIVGRQGVFGNLYLTEKEGAPE